MLESLIRSLSVKSIAHGVTKSFARISFGALAKAFSLKVKGSPGCSINCRTLSLASLSIFSAWQPIAAS